ncbi:MAG: chromosomal replication initiator protein DnaA [Hyphomicrobiales bacterium]
MSHSSALLSAEPTIAKTVDHDASWDRVRRRLRAELGDDVFSSWFGRLELSGLSGETAHLSVPTRFLKSWIQSHYIDRLRALVFEEFIGLSEVVITVRSATQKPVQKAQNPQATEVTTRDRVQIDRAPSDAATPTERVTTSETDSLGGAPLDRRLTFANFLVGKSNQLAHAAAERVAGNGVGEAPLYNPLYIHAGVGLGKTHLLHAIAHETIAQGRRVIYLTADRFMYGFVAALKAQTALNFKERLRGIDLLVIDDVQFLQGKSIQQEFCHTLNALIDSGRQIVIAADRPPSDLESLDERVKSRLAGGLVVEMGPLDENLRIRIIEARIVSARQHQPNFDVNANVIAYVAKSIVSNGRDLDGAVNRLLAHSTLTGGALTVEAAEAAIRDLIRAREPRKVKIEDIQKLVATHFNVSRADILSSRRSAGVVKPRQIAMYLAKVLTLRSLPEIGRRFGGRDHTTVLHAVRKIEGAVAADNGLRDDVELLKRMLQD